MPDRPLTDAEIASSIAANPFLAGSIIEVIPSSHENTSAPHPPLTDAEAVEVWESIKEDAASHAEACSAPRPPRVHDDEIELMRKDVGAPATAPWMYYSRFAAVKGAEGGSKQWIVMSTQYGTLAEEPCVFAEYMDALRRADALNAAERNAMLGLEPNS